MLNTEPPIKSHIIVAKLPQLPVSMLDNAVTLDRKVFFRHEQSSMTTTKLPKKVLARQHEIVAEYLQAIDVHLADILAGRVTEMYEIRDLAREIHLHPTHLSNTIKLTTGKAPCFFYEEKILIIAKDLLLNTAAPIASIAGKLTYDPSNFTKFFKHFEGVTPKQFREQALLTKTGQKKETVTI